MSIEEHLDHVRDHLTLCGTCGVKFIEPGSDECFRCRVSSVGFNFVGGGGYGREAFQRTTNEFLNENIGFDHKEQIRSDKVTRRDDRSWS